jgi:glycosyltransferase involved in cell wall biosynthesis
MRVLHLITYPVELPRHGGQARVANIVQTYAAAGIESRTIAVYQPEYYTGEAVGRYDLAFPPESPFREQRLPQHLCTDLVTGHFAAEDPDAWGRLAEQATAFRPDVIQLEQPWLWPFVKRLRMENRVGPFRVVYSSQNIEAPLKARLLADQPPAVASEMVARIDALEREVAVTADVTFAVTASDAAALAAWGARRIVMAPNGIAERVVDPAVVRDWRRKLDGRAFALFVGSAYGPNVTGFWEMFSPSLAFLAPDQRVLVVGGISDMITHTALCREWPRINESRLERVGVQSEASLAALLQLASCVVLPITVGGGSNIKTAEAIASGRPVVGTTASFRGYERTTALPHVYATDDSVNFRRLVKAALDAELPPAGSDRPELRRQVLWSETLKALPGEVAALQ